MCRKHINACRIIGADLYLYYIKFLSAFQELQAGYFVLSNFVCNSGICVFAHIPDFLFIVYIYALIYFLSLMVLRDFWGIEEKILILNLMYNFIGSRDLFVSKNF